jgi:hypothetical protein
MNVSTFTARAAVVALISTSAIFSACRPSGAEEEIFNKRRSLAERYMSGDFSQAERSLEQEIQLFENATNVDQSRRASSLFMASCRWYVLELRAGNEKAAKAALIKSRYWNLRRHEIDGVPFDQAVDLVGALTSEKIIEMIDNFDRYFNNGHGPRYLRDLPIDNAPRH